MPLTLNVVSEVLFERLPLTMLQLPLEDVVQLSDEPPTVKLPATTAPGTSTPFASLTATVTVARHPLRTRAALPISELTETSVKIDAGGSLLAVLVV